MIGGVFLAVGIAVMMFYMGIFIGLLLAGVSDLTCPIRDARS